MLRYVPSLQGISGPSSVYVNVICERKHTADPVSPRCYNMIHYYNTTFFIMKHIFFFSNCYIPINSHLTCHFCTLQVPTYSATRYCIVHNNLKIETVSQLASNHSNMY